MAFEIGREISVADKEAAIYALLQGVRTRL